MAEHEDYAEHYEDSRGRGTGGFLLLPVPFFAMGEHVGWCRRELRRPWHSFDRAHRAAAFHERMTVAAKRQEVA